jgi:hypothetical protein
MKTVLKLLIVAVILNGLARVGLASMRYYQFREAAQQAVLFGAGTPTVEVHRIIVERATELNLPIRPEDIVVRRLGGRTWADANYRQGVEVFPEQQYPVDFSFSVESYSMVLGPP